MTDYHLLLFPQTIPFPSRVEKALEELEEILVLELPLTKESWQIHWAKLLPKTKFLRTKPEHSLNFEHLKKVFFQLKDWALYLRDVENLKILKMHAQSFEDFMFYIPKNIQKNEETFSTQLEKAYLTLMLAEDVDLTLSVVKKNISAFEKTWEEFFREGIVGDDPFFKPLELRREESYLAEELQKLNRRVAAWDTILPYLDLEEIESLKLLVSEPQCVELLKKTKILEHPKIKGLVALF